MKLVNKLYQSFLYDAKGFVIFDDLTMRRIKNFFDAYTYYMIQRRYLAYSIKVNECVIEEQKKKVQKIIGTFQLPSRKLDKEQMLHVLYNIDHKVVSHIDTVIRKY